MEKIIYSNYPTLKKVKDKLKAYFEENNLSPLKSYSKDPIHGPIITALVRKLNIQRAKVLGNDTFQDKKQFIKLTKLFQLEMALKNKKKGKTAPVEEEASKKGKKSSKEEATEKPKRVVASKYDYPLIDGREMTKDEKKKYRAAQRKENNPAPEKKGKKEKKVEVPVKEEKPKKKDKKVKKETTPEKPLKKAKKVKSKKAPKDED